VESIFYFEAKINLFSRTFHIYCRIWGKLAIPDPSFNFEQIGVREAAIFLRAQMELICTFIVILYDILKVNNVLAKCVYRFSTYTIYNLVMTSDVFSVQRYNSTHF
jgi:hypothetical protein